MGSYKWAIGPLIRVISKVALLTTPFFSAHEPPSLVNL